MRGGRRLRDVEVDVTATTCVSEDAEKAFRSSKRQSVIGILWTAGVDKYAKRNYQSWSVPKRFSVPEDVVEELSRWDWWTGDPLPDRLARLLTKEIVEQFVIFGTPKQVAERYRELMDYPDVGCIRIPLLPVEGKSAFEGFEETINGIGKAMRILKA